MSEYKKLTLNGADFPKYESPIQVLFDDDCPNPIITEFEDAIVAQVSQTLHIKIDKGELEKALAYDRGQYEKGYKDALGEQSTVDAVPIRCRDCKWWDKVDNIDGVNYGTCERKCTAIRKDAFLNENWFCADGERR